METIDKVLSIAVKVAAILALAGLMAIEKDVREDYKQVQPYNAGQHAR